MANEENIHAGHRERMMNKLSISPDSLCEHELLEILLFHYIPRVNTNGIAHRLINTFGSLKRVFEASVKELVTVEGIGKKTAESIVLLSKIIHNVNNCYDALPSTPFLSLESYKSYLSSLFSGLYFEKLVVLMLDAHQVCFGKLEYEGNSHDCVSVRTGEILNALFISKPAYIIICHNHPSGNILPSENDTQTTIKFLAFSSAVGATLIDHVIINPKGETFSFHYNGVLDDLKKEYTLDNLVKEKIKNEKS